MNNKLDRLSPIAHFVAQPDNAILRLEPILPDINYYWSEDYCFSGLLNWTVVLSGR